MNTQINVRLPETLLTTAKNYADKYGFGTVQELIKETLREKVYMQGVTKKELALIKNFIKAAEEKNLYGTEEELFKKLKK